MSRPSPAKAARRRQREAKADRHAANQVARYERAEARRKVREADAAELRKAADEARRVAWEAGAADREAEHRARVAEGIARRAARDAEEAANPPAPRPRQRGARMLPLLAVLLAATCGGEER